MPACIKSIACAFAVLILVGFMLADPVAAGEAEMLNGDAFMALNGCHASGYVVGSIRCRDGLIGSLALVVAARSFFTKVH